MNKKKLALIIILTLVLTFVINMSLVSFAYFVQNNYRQSWNEMEVALIFGRLDPSANPTGIWGSDTNPYLIEDENHFRNLQSLQNRADRRIIDENTVFQLSDKFGKPNYIGGASASNLMDTNSIGTEEYPFTSKLRGVKATASEDFVTLPTGERSDTSTIGNIRVNATTNQVDIGLFGNVGPTTMPLDGQPVGEITTLLLYNVQIDSDSVGTHNQNHRHFVTTEPYETNHTGILIGHAQYTEVSNISVYYSGPDQNKDVKAFRIHAGTSAKYTTAQGIIGYYTNIIVNDENTPVSSTGFISDMGGGSGSSLGFGSGIVYAEDIWKFMEGKVFGGTPQTNESYPFKETFGAELYGELNDGRSFSVGVFTFAHSAQAQRKDRLEQLWKKPGSENWKISTVPAYSAVEQTVATAKHYPTTRLTSALMVRDGTTHILQAPYNDQSQYRYMITVTAGEGENLREFALIRNADNMILKEIDPNNFVISESDLNYYTLESVSKKTADTRFPPFDNAAYRFDTLQQMRFHYPEIRYSQFAGYGSNIEDSDPNHQNRYAEGVRPMRILNDGNPPISFNASTGAAEGILYIPASKNKSVNTNSEPVSDSNNQNDYYDTFLIQRGYPPSIGTLTDRYMTFNENTLKFGTTSAGGTQQDRFNAAVKTRIYAVNKAGATDGDLRKLINTPTSGVKNYDMSETVLRYTGTASSTNPAVKYKYNVTSLQTLGWVDNNGKILSNIDKTLTMGTGTSYYSSAGKYWGVHEELPSPITPGSTINVPYGAIGFTVAATGSSTARSKVYVIAASDPSTDVNQEITISRFGSATAGPTTTGARTVIGTFSLPPVPDRVEERTLPITINDNGVNYTAYPNMNRLLVAYEFEVRNQWELTYFLEASIGVASIVYLSAEQTSSTDNNGNHHNKVNFPYLSGIDYITKSTTSDDLHTVDSPGYTPSLTALYYGLKPNPANATGEDEDIDPLLVSITNGLDFTYEIGRIYNTAQQKYYLFVTINVEGYSNSINRSTMVLIMNNYRFEFTEWTALDTSTLGSIYSDVMVMKINGYTITDWINDFA